MTLKDRSIKKKTVANEMSNPPVSPHFVLMVRRSMEFHGIAPCVGVVILEHYGIPRNSTTCKGGYSGKPPPVKMGPTKYHHL